MTVSPIDSLGEMVQELQEQYNAGNLSTAVVIMVDKEGQPEIRWLDENLFTLIGYLDVAKDMVKLSVETEFI